MVCGVCCVCVCVCVFVHGSYSAVALCDESGSRAH